MKTTLELPDDLMRRIKLRAVHCNRKLKDEIAQLLEAGLAGAPARSRRRRRPSRCACAAASRSRWQTSSRPSQPGASSAAVLAVDTNVLADILLEGDRTPQAQALYARDPDWRSEG